MIHCFAPVTCQPPSTCSARVTIAPASEPAPGSVSAKQPICSPARERRHEPRSLLVRAELQQRQRARRRVHGNRHTHTGVGARELLEHQNVGHEVCSGAAVLLRHAHAEQTQLGERCRGARAGIRAHDPSRLHAARSRRARPHGRRPESRAVPPSARSPLAADYRHAFRGHRAGCRRCWSAAAAPRAAHRSRSFVPGAPHSTGTTTKRRVACSPAVRRSSRAARSTSRRTPTRCAGTPSFRAEVISSRFAGAPAAT